MSKNKNVTVDGATSSDVIGGILKSVVLVEREKNPRIVEVSTEEVEERTSSGKKYNIVYNGRVVIDDPEGVLSYADVETVIHRLKHCFKGDHHKVPQWMVDEFRSNSSKHSRVGIAYTITRSNSDGRLIVDFYRSMAEGACGAHHLCKITEENANLELAQTRYNGKRYYVVPMATREANRLMGLFGNMAADALESCIFEQVVRAAEKADVEEAECVIPLNPAVAMV